MKTQSETENELKRFWRVNNFEFTAIYIEANGNPRFVSLRKPTDGNQVFLPNGLPVTVKVTQGNYEVGKRYHIHCILAYHEFRQKNNLEYLLWLDWKNKPPILLQNDPKSLIESIYKDYTQTTHRIRETLEGAIKRIANDINKRPETFIYELLQNANDYPASKDIGVDIQFKISANHLLLTHNGLPFSEENVESICKANAGDKAYDRGKIGYKGIGFKSIFKLSDFVLINSGGFRFRFDEYYHLRKGTKTFWQIIPIWTESIDVPVSLQNPEFLESNVSIAIRPKGSDYSLENLEKVFRSVFIDDRILLFLKNVNSVTFKGKIEKFEVSKGKLDWEVSNLDYVSVPKQMLDYLNKKIKDNDIVPEKFEDIELTQITFACKAIQGEIEPITNGKIYVYLPTEVDLGFPFLINGDFIPDGGRQLIHAELEWNQFLFRAAGKQFISWLRELCLKFENISLTKIIPDINQLINEARGENKGFLELFLEGILEGVSEIAFLPALDGNLFRLQDLIEDNSGLAELLGYEGFQELTKITSPVLHPAFAIKPVLDWKKQLGIGAAFDIKDLSDWVAKEFVVQWLSNPENNLAFLEHFQLNEILDSKVVLDSNGNLQVRKNIFHSFGEDADLINWIGASCFHPILSDFFKSGDLGELEYTPVSFVENFIIPNSSEIDEKLKDPENCIKFYQYLFKHHKTLPDKLFEKDKLYRFKFLDAFGSVCDSFHIQGQYIYFSHESVTELVIQEAIPTDQFRLLSPETYGMETSQSIDFWKKFQVKEVNADNWIPFLEKEIKGKRSDFEMHFLSLAELDGAIARNACLWIFLFSLKDKIPNSDWTDLCTDIGSLPVFTVTGECKSLSDTYLSSSYTGNNALELLSNRFEEIEVDFISEGYLQDPNMKPRHWRSLFQEFNAKSDEEQLLVHYIIPRLSSLSKEEIVPTTRLIFENGIKEELKGLQIKTVSGDYLPAAETLLGPPFMEADYRDQTLPSFPLANVVSSEYLTGNNPEKWKQFFVRLGVKTVENQSEFISLKISDAIAGVRWAEVNEESKAASIQFIQELIDLHEQNLLAENHYVMLKHLPVLSHSLEGDFRFSEAETLWLGSGYNPRFDLESSLGEEGSDEFFLDEIYVSDSISEKLFENFFVKIGAFEDFEVRQEDTRKRTEAPADFIAFIDRVKPSIASNARSYNGIYINQHSISNWKYLPFIDYLRNPKISLVFWKKFSSDWNFREQILEETNYSCFIGVTKIINPILWWLQTNPCLPVGDGLTCMPTSNAVSFTFRQFSEDHSRASCINLKNLNFGNQSVEKLLGVKFEPDLATILKAISHVRNFEKLKELDFWNKLKELLSDPDSTLSPECTSSLEAFKENGLLPNQTKQFIGVKNLFFLQPGLKLGLGSHPNLLHKDLEEIAPIFGLRELTEENFNPTFHHAREDQEFKSRLIKHLGFVAFAESQENWTSHQKEYYEAISPIQFQTVSEIEFSFSDVSPPIQNSEKTFYVQGEKVFYVGNWNGPYSNELFKYLHKILGLKGLSRKTFTDLLLFEVSDVIQLFFKKNISVPEALVPIPPVMPSSTKSMANEEEEEYETPSNITEATNKAMEAIHGISEIDLKELENLLGRNLGDNERENANLIALFRCIKYCQKNYYHFNPSSSSIDEAIELRFIKATLPSGEKLNVMFRSARGKLLHLNYSAWFDLDKSNTWLFVITGNAEDDFRLIKTQEELAKSKDAWVMKVGGEDKLDDLMKLISGNYSIEGNQFEARVQFLIRLGTQEYQSIFEKLPQIGSEW